MLIKQFVDAGLMSRVLVYNRHPNGAVLNFTIGNGDEVTIYAGEAEIADLQSAIDVWVNEKAREIQKELFAEEE